MNQQNEIDGLVVTQTLDLSALAIGVLNAQMQAELTGDFFDRIRAGVLMESWGRLVGLEPPSPDDPDYDAKATALFEDLTVSAAQYVGDGERGVDDDSVHIRVEVPVPSLPARGQEIIGAAPGDGEPPHRLTAERGVRPWQGLGRAPLPPVRREPPNPNRQRAVHTEGTESSCRRRTPSTRSSTTAPRTTRPGTNSPTRR